MSIVFDKEAWLEQRKKYVTASDVASILGHNPYSNAGDVRAQKISGASLNLDGIARVVSGTFLEGGIFDWFVSRHPEYATARRNTDLIESPVLPCLAATPDGWWDGPDGERCAIEIKNVGGFSAKMWQRPSDSFTRPLEYHHFADGGLVPKDPLAAPAHYVCQLRTQLHVLGAETGWLVACVGGQALYELKYARDRVWEDNVLLPTCEAFWRSCQKSM